MKNTSYLKKKLFNKKPIYINCLNTIGINNYRAKFTLNLYNNCLNKSNATLNKIYYKCINVVNKHTTFNTNLFKKNSIKLNTIRLNILKRNENKNIYKKNM